MEIKISEQWDDAETPSRLKDEHTAPLRRKIGYLAINERDILLVDGNPLEDLRAVTNSDNLKLLMKDGKTAGTRLEEKRVSN